ncbi:MAG TPA: hypothetical protein VNN22_11040 [Verrucomicrobiae bacterium]|nr:hypothetical protein [Verrucomicrobiae bacterium]
MNLGSIKIWLKKNKSDKIIKKYFEAGLSLFGGIIVLFITFWLTYFVVWLASSGFFSVYELFFGTKLKLGSNYLLIISGIFIMMLFVQYLRMDPWSWGRYSQEEFDVDARLRSDVRELMPSVDMLEHSGNTAKAIADVLVTGPRLLMGSLSRLKEISQIKHIKVDKCAEALTFIYSRTDSVSYEDFHAAGFGEQLQQMKGIDGVSFLKSGLLLSDELRNEFNNLK